MKLNELAIIDFEFTGLDNTFITDNEIIQMKVWDCETETTMIRSFQTNKKSGAGAFLCHRIDNSHFEGLFTKGVFELAMKPFIGKKLLGFSVQQDIKMLHKYGIGLEILDLKNLLMLNPLYEQRLALEGNGLEECYYIVTGKIPNIENHGTVSELYLIKDVLKTIIGQEYKLHLDFVPFGHCAGMPLRQYVIEYRRQADGYRYNNADLFARSLDNEIYCLEMEQVEDEDEFFS